MNEKVENLQATGSMAVGRRLSVGRDIRVGGSLNVKHDVRIEGWLDAPNLRSPAKGIFLTAAELEDAHREPRPGSWALVGSELPAELYVARGRRWHNTGKLTGTPLVSPQTTDSGETSTPSENCTECRAELDALDLRTEKAEESADNAYDRANAVGIVPFDGFNPFRGPVRPSEGVWFVPRSSTSPGNFWIASSDYGLTYDDYNDGSQSPSGSADLGPARTDRLYRLGSKLYTCDGSTLVPLACEPLVAESAEEAEELITSDQCGPGRFCVVVDPATRRVNAIYLA